MSWYCVQPTACFASDFKVLLFLSRWPPNSAGIFLAANVNDQSSVHPQVILSSGPSTFSRRWQVVPEANRFNIFQSKYR